MTNKLFVDYENAIFEVLKLKEIPESSLLKPIQEGKWSVRDIIGHLFYWDKYILDRLVPHITNNAILPPFPDFDLHNQEALKYIERYSSVISLIDEFSQTRKLVIEKMFCIENNTNFTIGTYNFTKDSFIIIFTEHDTHHLKQIWDYLSLE
jgi:uncharacterized damage-inducible protein DinB